MPKNYIEKTFVSSKIYVDPFNEIELDVLFTDPQGQMLRVPAFWAGENTWKVRFAPATGGRHVYRVARCDQANSDLHDQTGEFDVAEMAENPRLSYLRVAEDRRHLERADGSPFFWLGDTWWLGL